MSSETFEIVDDAETQLEQLAASSDKSESQIRAMLWEEIANQDTGTAGGEELFEKSVNLMYEDAVSRLNGNNGGEATASANSNNALDDLHGSDEPLEAYGSGVKGDTSRKEYQQRQKQANIMADALDELEKRRE